MIEKTKKQGEIYIHRSFNINPVDILIRYRDCKKKNFFSDSIDQKG